MARSELKIEDLTAIIDTREQTPLNLDPIKTIPGTLATGDYSILGLENVVTVERKSLQDLVMCVGVDRQRFEREMHRILAFPSKLVVVESSFHSLTLKNWRGRVEPSHVIGSVLGWMAAGVPFLFAMTREEAGRYVARFLYITARRRWREAQSLVENLTITPPKAG